MTPNTDANGHPSKTRGPYLLAGFVTVAGMVLCTACGSVGASDPSKSKDGGANDPKVVTADSIDPLFTQPYVDVDAWRDTPVSHRYVHGGFKGTETRFSMYFPPKEQYQGRFFQPLAARAGVDNTSRLATGANTPIGFAVASGGYLVESNQGQLLGSPSDKALIPWRA